MGRFPACGQLWRSTRRYSNAVTRPLYVQNAAASRVGKTRLPLPFLFPKPSGVPGKAAPTGGRAPQVKIVKSQFTKRYLKVGWRYARIQKRSTPFEVRYDWAYSIYKNHLPDRECVL